MKIEERLLDEMVQIKKLLLFKFLKEGTDATEIGKVLGLTSARVGQIIPVRYLKKKKGTRTKKGSKQVLGQTLEEKNP